MKQYYKKDIWIYIGTENGGLTTDYPSSMLIKSHEMVFMITRNATEYSDSHVKQNICYSEQQ